MQRREFEKHWSQYKNSIQHHWNKLTSDDVYAIDGMYDHFIGCLVKRYGCSRETAEKEIENWSPDSGKWASQEPRQKKEKGAKEWKGEKEQWQKHEKHAESKEWKGKEQPMQQPEWKAKQAGKQHKKRKAG